MNWSKTYTFNGSTGAKLYVTVATISTDIAKNQSTERVTVRFHNIGTSSWGTVSGTINYNGNRTPFNQSYSFGSNITLLNKTYTTTHNTDGKKSVSFSFSGNGNNSPYITTLSVSETIQLDTIPRYTKINTFTITNATLETLRVNWATADTVDRVQYQIGSGTWTNGYSNSTGAKSGNFTLSGLSPNTEHTIKIRARRKDSGLDTTSGSKKGKTLNIARFTDVPNNIDIDKPFTVKFNRNAASTVELCVYLNDFYYANYRVVSGTSYTFDFSSTEKNRFYDDMKTVNSKSLRVYIATNGNTYRDYTTKNFVITNANPIFNDFTYEDVNSKTLSLTGDNQRIVQNYSDLQVDITTATPFRGSTIKKYIVINGSNTKTYTSSGVKNIGKVQAQQLQVIVQDSRGNRSQLMRQLDYIPYTQPIIQNFNLDREIGTSTSADLVTNGLYTAVDFGAVNNSITKVEYRSKTTGDYGAWTDITSLVVYGSGKFNQAVTNSIDDFAFGTEYTVEVRITDELTTVTKATVVSKGLFLMLIDQEYESIGIGEIPKPKENSLALSGGLYSSINLPPRTETTNLDFNKTEEEWGSVRYDIATRQVTQGKPMADGFVTTYFWDNSGKFDSQLYIPNGETNSRVPQWRSRGNNDQWGEWQDINPSSTYVQVQLSGNFTLNANNKRFDNLYRGAYNGSGLTVSTTGVTIGAGISTIEISAMYYYRHLASSGERDLYMEIRKGSTVINRISKSFSATSVSEGMAFAPFYVDVEQGDKIEMWATNTGGGDSYMAGYHPTTGPRTHLLIKKVR